MKHYSQNAEDLFVLNYFGAYKGTLLEIGANNGRDFSNSLALIQSSWVAHLLEPGSTFDDLRTLHEHNQRVKCYNLGIGERSEYVTFFESGAHVRNGKDRGLVSTCDATETERWRNAGVTFEESEIELMTFEDWYEYAGSPKLDYISIDAEGMDMAILLQINLDRVGCKCLVIEWNSNLSLRHAFEKYCTSFGLSLRHSNPENLIFCK